MLNIYNLPQAFQTAPAPATLGGLLQALHGEYDQIARVEFASLEEMQRASREQMHYLTQSLEITNRRNPRHPQEVIQIEVYWATNSDIVLWAKPPKAIYHSAILFDIYGEFVQWTQWRLRAGMDLSEDDFIHTGLVLESLKIKATSPRCLTDISRPVVQPMTTDLNLI